MDPVSIAVIASTILSTLGAVAQPIIQSIKSGKWEKLDKVRNAVQRALALANNKGQAKLDELSSKLMSLDLIQRTPALSSAIDNAKQKVKDKINSLRDDISEMELLTVETEQAANRAEDSNLFQIGKRTKQAEEAAEKNVQQIKEIERRL